MLESNIDDNDFYCTSNNGVVLLSNISNLLASKQKLMLAVFALFVMGNSVVSC